MAVMNHKTSIPVAGPSITELEVDYVCQAIRSDWYDQANNSIGRFERNFSEFAGRRFAISLPSCTSGLHLSLLALGVGPGAEVIVPDVTWIASVAPVTYVGAEPIFAEIDPANWCLDEKDVERLITAKTRAIIAVNLYGHMPNYDQLVRLCKRHNLALIEDAAESFGSRYGGRNSGGFGDCSTFSFHGSKTLTTGEGGMVLTDDETLYKRMLVLRDHGRNPGDTMFRNIEVGYKYKMSGLQAALGLAQLERGGELVAKKKQIFSWYQDRLSNFDKVHLNPRQPKVDNSYWMTTILIDSMVGKSKDVVINALKELNIQTRPFFDPLSKLEAFRNYRDRLRASNENVTSYEISSRGINLPSALNLTEGDVDYVCSVLKKLL